MNNEIAGYDIAGARIWEMEQLNETYNNIWIGTGPDLGIIRHLDAKGGVEFYLSQCSKTHTIRAVINNQYHGPVRPESLPRKSYIDVLAKELGLEEQEDE